MSCERSVTDLVNEMNGYIKRAGIKDVAVFEIKGLLKGVPNMTIHGGTDAIRVLNHFGYSRVASTGVKSEFLFDGDNPKCPPVIWVSR